MDRMAFDVPGEKLVHHIAPNGGADVGTRVQEPQGQEPDGTSPHEAPGEARPPLRYAPPGAERPTALLDRCRGRAPARVVGGEGYAVRPSRYCVQEAGLFISSC